MNVCILIKNSKYGHDYEVYSETEAKTVDLEKEQEKWHQELIDECDIEPSEDDYVAWYDGGWGTGSLIVKGVTLEEHLDKATDKEIEQEREEAIRGA